MTWIVLTLTLLSGGPHTVAVRSDTGAARATLDGVSCEARVHLQGRVSLWCEDGRERSEDAGDGGAGLAISNVEATATTED